MAQNLSAATRRAGSYTKGPEWFCELRTKPITGDLAECTEGVIRRDPSAVIEVEGQYHVWYTKSLGLCAGFGTGDPAAKVFPWDHADVWHATSADGWHWEEQALAVGRGEAGAFHDRFLVVRKGSFDSHKVHDPCLMHYRDRFYLYYKGEVMGEEMTFGGRETQWGVAIADRPEGPYVKSEYNPVTNSGHEVCVWHYNGGIAALLTTDGPEKNTIQWAPDGINFEIQAVLNGAPHANGLFRTPDHGKGPLEGLRWGLCHSCARNTGFFQRFGVDETLKNWFLAKATYE